MENICRSMFSISPFTRISIFHSCVCLPIQFETFTWGSRDGTVVRALASHQCRPGSIPGLVVICGLSLLLVIVLAPRGFSRFGKCPQLVLCAKYIIGIIIIYLHESLGCFNTIEPPKRNHPQDP